MPFLLRKVSLHRWFKDANRTWLPADEPPGDVLADLKTEGCAISVYRVDDERANLDSVLAGLAAATDRADKLDFMLLPEPVLEPIGVKRRDVPGETPSAIANALHVDLLELSAGSVVEIARLMYRDVTPVRRSKAEIKELVKQAVVAGTVDKTKLKPAWVKELEQ